MIGSLFQPPSSWWFSTVDYDHPPMAVSAESNPATIRPRGRRESLHVLVLYVLALVREFRWTLLALLAAVSFGTTVFAVTTVDGSRPSFALSVYGAWMALLAQPIYNPPPTVPTAIVCAVYPLVGAVVIGEGVVRLAMLMMSCSDRLSPCARMVGCARSPFLYPVSAATR